MDLDVFTPRPRDPRVSTVATFRPSKAPPISTPSIAIIPPTAIIPPPVEEPIKMHMVRVLKDPRTHAKSQKEDLTLFFSNLVMLLQNADGKKFVGKLSLLPSWRTHWECHIYETLASRIGAVKRHFNHVLAIQSVKLRCDRRGFIYPESHDTSGFFRESTLDLQVGTTPAHALLVPFGRCMLI